MPLTDQTLLHDFDAVRANVEPVVLFSIIDHHSRRDEGQVFVVGTLLGTEEGGVVTISSSFPVPFTMVEDQIALNTDFHTTMLGLTQRVSPKHKVVGWYSTGEAINDFTPLFHDFFAHTVERPVHLLFDLGLGERRMSCKAYVSSGLTLGDVRVATAFRDISLTIVSGESDRMGLDTLQKLKMAGPSGAISTGAGAGASDLGSIERTVTKLLRTLEGVTDHVAKVVEGCATAEPEVVRLLQQLVAAAPRLPTESFGKMFNTQVQDMLTVVYLANLTRTQLALAEKLQSAVSSQAES